MSTYPDAPGHRHAEMSVAAADALAPKLGRLQRMVQAAIRDADAHGLTADELAARLELDRWSIQPRTTELRRRGLIRDSGQRRRNATGKLAIVWIAA
jgi:DNA-binding transcriptional regulator LsrR (DeoR family)